MRYAVVVGNVITNVIIWDGVSEYEFEDSLVEVPEEVGIGWHLSEAHEWMPPSPPVEEEL